MRDRRLAPLLALTAVFFVVGGWFLLNSSIFAIRRVEVSGNRALSSAEAATVAGVDHGDNLFRLSPERVEASLLRHPWVASVVVERRWPSTLVLRITERRAVGWGRDADGSMVLVAGDGVVLGAAPTRPAALPLLGSAARGLEPGDRWSAPTPVRVAASFPPALRPEIGAVRAGESGVILRLRRGGTALYGQPSSLAAKNAALQSILRRGLEIEYADLRIASAPAVKPG